MKLLVRVSKDGECCEVYWGNDVSHFATYTINPDGVVNFRQSLPHWVKPASFNALVKVLYEQWIANSIMEVYDDSLHEYKTDLLRGISHQMKLDGSKYGVGNAAKTGPAYS